jgi:exodeoxyribonuclease V gamma subunit
MTENRFFLYTSNRSEALLDSLALVLEHAPPKLFQTLPFLIQGKGMERWLQQRLSERFGVWASAEFLFPNAFFDRLAQQLNVQLSVQELSRERLRWRIDALLRQPPFADLPALQNLLRGEGQAKWRFQLAERLADLFDQYQISRMDWLNAWSQGKNPVPHPQAEWQMALWQALNLKPHRGQLWQQLIEALDGASRVPGLDSPVVVFGVSFMPLLMLEVLRALSRHVPVHVFSLSPSDTFWADLPGRKQRLEALEETDYLPLEHHPLLQSLGKQGAHFQHLLLEAGDNLALDFSCFADADADSLLGHLQNDLRNNEVTPLPASARTNIEFHRCHTPQRQVEVLRNRILSLLQENPRLSANDIVVMSPQIEAFRPYIETLFADIPHSIADRRLASDAPAIQLLVDWLGLVRGRLGWDEVLAFLQNEILMRRFHLSPLELESLDRALVQQGQVRWGLAGDDHRNHWLDGVRRVLLGSIMNSPDELWHDMAPVTALEGQSISQLAPLLQLLEQLAHWQRLAARSEGLPMAQWLQELVQLVDFLFGEDAQRLPLDEALADLREESAVLGEQPVVLETLTAWATTLGEERRAAAGFLADGITFCDLLPMRAIPVPVAFLLGMDDMQYPRPANPSDFDLTAHFPLIGDRDLRAEDRYTFLELLLGVRQRLGILWQGLSADKNQPQPPAQVVLELMEVLQNDYRQDIKTLQYDHHAVPFHSEYFRPDTPAEKAGRLPEDFAVCQAIQQSQQAAEPFWQHALSAMESPLPLDTLSEALAQPVHWALQQARLSLHSLPELPEPREKISVDGLDQWRLREFLKGGDDIEAQLCRLRAEGRWPTGSSAEKAVADTLDLWQRLHDRYRQACAEAGPPLESERADVAVEETTISHRLEGLHDKRRVVFHPHRLKGKDRLHYWLEHLHMNAQGSERPSQVVYLDKNYKGQSYPATLIYFPLPQQQALTELAAWLAVFRQNLKSPALWDADWADAWLRFMLARNPDESKARDGWMKAAEIACGLREPGSYGRNKADPAVLIYTRHLSEEELAGQLTAGFQQMLPRMQFWRSHQERS